MQSDAESASASVPHAATAARGWGASAVALATAHDGLLDRFEVTVRVGPLAPASARAALTEWLNGRVIGGVIENARLLVSELVTNCLQHGQMAAEAPVRVSAYVADGVLRLEVENPGRHGSVKRRTPDPYGGGYGLNLLELLATRWGVKRVDGTQVWFELAARAA